MRVLTALSFVLGTLPLFFINVVFGNNVNGTSSSSSSLLLEKRMSNARFSYYAVGLGACGITNSPGDFVSNLVFFFFSCINFT